MNDVDVSKIKPGDTAGFVVVDVAEGGDAIAVRGLVAWIPVAAIVSHTPAPKPALKVGDRVLSPAGSRWDVVFIQDGEHVHFGAVPGNCHFPTPLSEVETWERV